MLLTRAYGVQRSARSAGDWRIADAESLLGELLAAEGRNAEAEPCLLEGHRVLRAVRGEDADYTRDARRRLVELYRAQGRDGDAARWAGEQGSHPRH